MNIYIFKQNRIKLIYHLKSDSTWDGATIFISVLTGKGLEKQNSELFLKILTFSQKIKRN